MSKQEKKPAKSKPSSSAAFMKYMGMATQMAVTVGIGAFLGQKADIYFGNDRPLFAIMGAVIGITSILYVIVKDLSKPTS